jgi:hypothetical protein
LGERAERTCPGRAGEHRDRAVPLPGGRWRALPGSASEAADDFCFNKPRPNERCQNSSGHQGDDIFPTHGSPQPGDLRVIAAREGTVRAKGCDSPEGRFVKIEASNGRVYNYHHLDSFVPGLNVGDSVRAGEQIGEMGRTEWCNPVGGSTAVHLHFTHRDDMFCEFCYRDPYNGLKNAYARPGLNPDGDTVDGPIQNRWLVEISQVPSYKAALWYVGWPTRGSNLATANVTWGVSGPGALGVYQNLGTGVGGYDRAGYLRAGMIARRAQDTTAWRVWGDFFKRWTREGEFGGYLGWPLTNVIDQPNKDWQWFEGGCIYTYDGSAFHDRPWGVGGCQL